MKRNNNRYGTESEHSRKLMKTAAAGTLLALILSGCAQEQPVKTQPIASMESFSASQTEASQGAAALSESLQADTLSEETASLPAAPALTAASVSSDQDDDAEAYYRAKAEQDAIRIDIAKLEADFRVGKLSKDDFLAQKSQLVSQEDALDREEDRIEDLLELSYYQSNPSLPSGSLEELRTAKANLELQEHQLEAQEDALEQSYWAGEITRDDFIAQQLEIIRNEENLDREEELLEDAMEAMGFDD